MKKLTIILTAVVLFFSYSTFAMDPENISIKVKAAFEKDFKNAENVNWKKTDEFYFASFKLNNVDIDAAYNESGELIAASKSIAISALPMQVFLALTEKYKDYALPENVVEFTYSGETNYYITVSNEKRILKLKCNTSGNIAVEKKIKK
jgi:hypothetical protein